MKDKLLQNCNLPRTRLHFFIITLLLLGIFFRFVNLDRKIFWHDETYTSLWISGHSPVEVKQEVFTGHVVSVEDLHKYQHINPGRNVIDTVKQLGKSDPQHPPLYYVMARLWVEWFGDSVAALRSLSAFISLLAFPCAYWLCLELFKSPLTGWIAVALIAVSPLHVLYAQEARQYSLWTVTILLSSAALLRAMRLKTKASWGIYTATLVVGLYTFLFSGLVAIGHGIYVFATERFRFSKTVINYLLASFVGLLGFMPWLLVVVANVNKIQGLVGWTSGRKSLFTLLNTWIGNISRIFLDLNFNSTNPLIIYIIPPAFLLLILTGYSIYWLCRKTSKQTWLFILTLGGVTVLALVLQDLILGGQRSRVSRYLIPSHLSIQLTVAYLFSTQILAARTRKFWQIVMAVVISAGVISCAFSAQADTWWSKQPSDDLPQISRVVNQAIYPLVVSSNYQFNLGEILALSHQLDLKVKLLLVEEPHIPNIPDGFSDVFLFNPSQTLQNGLEKERSQKIERVDERSRLWRLNRE